MDTFSGMDVRSRDLSGLSRAASLIRKGSGVRLPLIRLCDFSGPSAQGGRSLPEAAVPHGSVWVWEGTYQKAFAPPIILNQSVQTSSAPPS